MRISWSQCRPAPRSGTSQSGCSFASALLGATMKGGIQMPARSARLGDAVRQTFHRPERGPDVEPVADVGLVTVVELDYLDRQLETLRRLDVLDHVLLRDVLEVVGPRRPSGRHRP